MLRALYELSDETDIEKITLFYKLNSILQYYASKKNSLNKVKGMHTQTTTRSHKSKGWIYYT